MAPAASRRMVIAAAGYGKTTALRRWCPAPGARWWPGGTDAAAFVVDAAAAGDGPIVLDDLPALPDGELRRLLRAVAGVSADVEIVLASRWPLAWRPHAGPGRWTEVGPAELACTVDDVAELLTEACGSADPDLAARLHAATAGWPALVQLAVEAVRVHGPDAEPAAGPLAAYVRDQVLPELPEDVRLLLARAGELSPLTAGLCAALGVPEAEALSALLRRAGVLVREPGAAPGLPVVERIVPVVARVAAADDTGGRDAARTAAAWYREHGPAAAAARELMRAGDRAGAAQLLREHGGRIVSGGHVGLVVRLVGELPPEERDERLWLLLGDALRTSGDLGAAQRAYEEAAGTRRPLPAATAWRLGRVSYQRGDAHGALAAFARAAPGESGADAALLAAAVANARLLAGDVDDAVDSARHAVRTAAAAGDDAALAAAYLSLALCLGVAGDSAGSAEHFALALPMAQRTGDVLLLTQIHTNRSYQQLQQAHYAAALESAELCAVYAQAAGSPSLHAIATSNEADALAMLGRYDEAARRYRTAIAHYQRHGSRRFAGAVLGLAELYWRRGWREQARAAYEQVVEVASGAGNAHVLVPALAGLALTVLADDVKAAAGYAEAAADQAGPELSRPALLAQGWIALHQGAPVRAAELATEAARAARTRSEPAGLADALELRAAAEADPHRARAALREARAIWAEAGAAVEAARIAVLAARLPGAGADERADALPAAQRLAAADALADRIGAATGSADRPQVRVRALGRFEVELAGQVVPASSWQSRKARDLLRILVARRGRPVPRSELCELLWPDADGQKTGHRLSVLLNIVRGVLDPAKVHAADHHLSADQSSIALNVATTGVDVEDFLDQVARARRLVEQQATEQARLALLAADQLYRADAFEDEPYTEWAGPLHEEARAAYLAMLRMLAHTSRLAGQPGAAVSYLLRLLERDPYDERAHRSLVRTLVAGGQHGEARRAFARYGDAMRAIGVSPPDRDLLVPVRQAAVARR
ncbi:BTAD domain-containing putative transcriptional regulator [Catellatospora sp. IY07-71]|uniref:BTAD domain-containing putative transcriptional regulator n=1 Tax=Catellatospora sp. IY07-71 TaxID=2728827 RepID=UPI001BB3119A|nr:BTAD domain-containing putative transcriptional regulator [Catellatospora sp. IY07-71]